MKIFFRAKAALFRAAFFFHANKSFAGAADARTSTRFSHAYSSLFSW
jgi:hypothetical protein